MFNVTFVIRCPKGGHMAGKKGAPDKEQLKRINRIEGQVRGIKKMVEEERYCIDIITQSSAIRSALSAVEDLMLGNHLSEHVIHQMKQGQERLASTDKE